MDTILHNSDQNSQVSTAQQIDREQVQQQLKTLGYKGGDRVYLRAFYPSSDPRKAGDAGRKAEATNLDQLIEHATRLQAEGRGVYLVVNGGGHTDKDVTETRAIFYEHDDLDKDIQIELWKGLGLPEPTLQIDTGGKSIHSYWVFDEFVAVSKWRSLQTDLLEFANADRSLKNPSRVMRLAGARHSSGNQSTIARNSGKRYTYDELRAIVPTPEKPEPTLGHSNPIAPTLPEYGIAQRCEDVRVPVPMPAPLLCALGKTNKVFLQGVSSQRNTSMAALARDLLGTANEFASLGQATSDNAYTLFIDACRRCSPGGGWDEKEWEGVWKSAAQSNPEASVNKASPNAVENCVKHWYWKEFGKKHDRGAIDKPEPKNKLSLSQAAEMAREILNSEQNELSANIKLEEVRQKAGMGDHSWENKIIKPLKRDMDAERFKLELLGLLQMEDPVERCRQIALLAPKYSMGAATVKEAMAAMKQRTQAPQVEVLTLDDLLASESEAMDWLVPGLLPVGETALLCALPKVGKSKLAVDLAFCVATGESRFLGQETKQGKVLLITPDASKQSLKHELTKRGFRSQDAKNLHVIPRWSIDQMAVLEAELENFRPDLVVIDSLKKVTAGKEISENSAEFADNIIALNDMLTRYRAAGILVHHANKGNDAIGVEKARGSTAIVGACWGMWMLDRIPKPDPNNAKKMIVDPKDPKRIFTATSRDSEGTTLSIEFNAENNSWDFMGEVGVDEAEAQQRQSHQERIINILRSNSSRELSGSEIMELLEVSKEQRNSIYVALGRMESKRLINVRPEPGDKRRSLYSLPSFYPTKETDHVTVKEKISLPPPPHTDTVSVVSCQSENHTEYGLDNNQHNNQHIPNNKSECGSVKNAESLTSKGINPIPNRLQLSGGGGGVKHNLEPDSVTVSTAELAQEQEPRSTIDANQSTAELIAPELQFTPGERVKVSAQYPGAQEYKGELATIVEVYSDGLCRIELDREISVFEGKPKKQFNINGDYLVLESAVADSNLNEDELELVEYAQKAIAENDPATAKHIQSILKENCGNGAADNSKIWIALTASEQTAFRALVLVEPQTQSKPIAPLKSESEQPAPETMQIPIVSEPHAPLRPPSKHKNFAVGDRVVVAHDGSMYEGAKGKVIKVKGQDVSIEFDKAVRGNKGATFNLASIALMKL